MPRGSPSPKISITMHPDVHAGMVEAAERDGVTVSAWVSKAAEDKLAIQRGLDTVAEWEATHGALTDEELAAARTRVDEQIRLTREWYLR